MILKDVTPCQKWFAPTTRWFILPLISFGLALAFLSAFYTDFPYQSASGLIIKKNVAYGAQGDGTGSHVAHVTLSYEFLAGDTLVESSQSIPAYLSVNLQEGKSVPVVYHSLVPRFNNLGSPPPSSPLFIFGGLLALAGIWVIYTK